MTKPVSLPVRSLLIKGWKPPYRTLSALRNLLTTQRLMRAFAPLQTKGVLSLSTIPPSNLAALVTSTIPPLLWQEVTRWETLAKTFNAQQQCMTLWVAPQVARPVNRDMTPPM